MNTRSHRRTGSRLARLIAGGLSLLSPMVFAADEICASCGQQVSVSGSFTHRREPNSLVVDGVGPEAALFREDVNGENFTVTIAHLPAGRYAVLVRATETVANGPGERVFDISCGDQMLAKNVDLAAAAGGVRRVASMAATVEHADDALGGPLTISFIARKGMAKFNTIDVKTPDGASVASFSASELADAFTAAAMQPPSVREPMIWRDPSHPLKERAADLIRRMSLAEKVAQLKNAAPAIPRLQLPAYDYWNEALHGVANNGIATVFPEPVGAASSWNPALFREEGTIIGIEGRAKFNDYATKHNGDSKWWTGLTYWAPNINIFRDPRWGRGQETYGEDPFLTAEIGIEFVKGVQGDDPNYLLAMACAKHYAVHSGPERERHRFDAAVGERDLYETYLPQFERVVREGRVAGVMGAYNSVNGVPACANGFLLDELLRREWGFEGYVVSDCDAVRDIWGARQHHYVNTAEQAAAAAIKAGCNLCCGGDYNALVRAVQQGLITEQDIDHALYFTLWTRFRLGLFDPPEKVPFSRYTLADNDTPEHGQVALELARQSVVLLKNDGILPLDRAKYKHIAVIGPNGKSTSMLHGNYHGSASHPISILEGIRQVAGADVAMTFALGAPNTTSKAIAPWSKQDNVTDRPPADLAAEALAVAKDADLIVYVGGITPAQEGESFDREAIELPDVQENLIRALQATGKPVVMVNCSGSAIALPWEDEHLPAIVQAWYPGQAGGRAVAEVLFGDVNPSGHLPITFYRATADLPAFTDYTMANRTYRYLHGRPLYAFGHGLSFTTFTYERGKLETPQLAPGGTAKLTFTIRNEGGRKGDDVAQIYYRHVNSRVPQPKLALCGFQRVSLEPGAATDVTIAIPTERLRYWNPAQKRYVVDAGAYEFLIGRAADDIKIVLPLTIGASAAQP